jgi:hypothetical protein
MVTASKRHQIPSIGNIAQGVLTPPSTPKEMIEMATKLQVDQALSATAQSVTDENGNSSSLSLATDKVGIGTTAPEQKLEVSGGAVSIQNPGEGQVLLVLGTERHWQLRRKRS